MFYNRRMIKMLSQEVDEQNELLFEKGQQLTKAKELLAKWVGLFKPKSNTALPTSIQKSS